MKTLFLLGMMVVGAGAKTAKTVWPKIAGHAQGIITPEQQAADPANAWMKPCAPDNHDDWCVQAAKPVAKQEKPPADPSKSDNSIWGTSNFTLTLGPDNSPCAYLGAWDEAKKVCTIYVTFGGNEYGPITCSPVSADVDGSQHMICWYKPKGAKP